MVIQFRMDRMPERRMKAAPNVGLPPVSIMNIPMHRRTIAQAKPIPFVNSIRELLIFFLSSGQSDPCPST